ncbi:DUF6236 family protein [Streptomyces profundus]|uniref:DUF6236 family protein n=1 Tax=Streptomyces profundus TaxID=2867410 RepID=UPI001D168231|nr:DUF6236 family protein [Streptomyces sp. MA3_2.13]UED83106.1 DUF6236 family protein [Streptomyces sp. MA3_2.13]
MHEIGLYYPYFHVRDDTWLKAAALYLPQVARVRPPRYPVQDSETAVVLRDELDFLRDVDPGPHAVAVARRFEALVDREEDRLREQYRLPPYPPEVGGFGNEVGNPWHLNESRFAWIHTSQLGVPASFDYREWEQILREAQERIGQGLPPETPELADAISNWSPPTPFVDRLCELGLAKRTRFDPLTGVRDDMQWIGMRPQMVSVYSCALANEIAEANSLTPVTHDPQFFALPRHWTVDDLSAALLQETPPASGPSAVLYACAAVQAVIPADLEHVPVERIVQARQALSDEFDAFRTHIDALGEEFVRLDGIKDPGIVRARLDSMVGRDLTKPAQELERGLRSLGLAPARAVFGLKSLELPAVAALAAHAMQTSPIIGAGGAVAVQLLSATRTARRTAMEQRKSAAGYLIGLHREIAPVTVLTRARQALFGRL